VAGKLGEDDEPSWVMGTISETVQYRMEHFRHKQIKLDQLTKRGWGDTTNYCRERDMKSGMNELKVPANIQTQSVDDAVSSAQTTFC